MKIMTVLVLAAAVCFAYGAYTEDQKGKVESAITSTPVPTTPVDVPDEPEPETPEQSADNVHDTSAELEKRLNSLDEKLTELLSLSKNATPTVASPPDADAELMKRIKNIELYLGELIWWKRGETPLSQQTSVTQGQTKNITTVPTYSRYAGSCSNGMCYGGW